MGGDVTETGVFIPPGCGVGVVTIAVLVTLPVAFALRVPRINRVAPVFAARSGSTVLPFHVCHVAPLSRLNCGFSTHSGSVSPTVGVFAADGPLLVTVMV